MSTIIVLAGLLLAQTESAADGLKSQVNKLLRQLDAAELSAREEAEEQLGKLGPAALPLLPADLEKIKSPEIKLRLGRIRQKLERLHAAEAAKPTLLTLPAGEITLKKFMAEVEKQTGNKIVDMRPKFGQEATDPKLKVDFDKRPFWPAMDAVLDQAKLTLYHFPGEAGLALMERPPEQTARSDRAVYAGPFRIEALRLAAKRDFRSPAHSQLQLTLEVAWEPRVSPINIQQPLDDVVCVDDAGLKHTLQNTDAEADAEVQTGTTAVELMLPLPLPTRATKKFTSVRGKLVALVPGSVESFEFDKLTEIKKQQLTKAGCTVHLDDVRKNGDAWEVHIRVHFDKTFGALESHRGWVFANPAYLLDADGQQVTNSGSETTLQADDEVGMAYIFDLPNGPAGHKFVYKTSAAIHRLNVEYDLKDLDLP